MEPIALTLSILRLTPTTLLDSPSSSISPQIEDVPATPAPRPSLPSSFSFSPTHNYPAPFGSMTLGTSLAVRVQLVANPPASPRVGDTADVGLGDGDDDLVRVPGVRGVKMMLEVQGPGGRWRLGEVVHGEEPESEGDAPVPDQTGAVDKAESAGSEEVEAQKKKVPILPPGEFVEMDVEAEMKELGLQVLICSVAWETPAGRRTFQRFYKFNVVAPLSIKTKIHPSQTPMTLLDPERRSDVYLEVLMQNTSTESILFDKVNLEPVFGMTATPITPDTVGSPATTELPVDPDAPSADSRGASESLGSLHPGDTRQYLFLLHPQPHPVTKLRQSVFPPVYAPGTILPLGRLDLAWLAGPHRERGRLQTSTLNRRVAAAALIPKIAPTPTRTGPPVPVPGQVAGTPNRITAVARTDENEYDADEPDWEFDLAVLDLVRSGLEVEKEFSAKLRVGIRSRRIHSQDEDTPLGAEEGPPQPVRIGIQYLTPMDIPNAPTTIPSAANSSNRPDLFANTSAGPSRSMTPISSQLRSAAQTQLNASGSSVPMAMTDSAPLESTSASFPPPPILQRPAPPPKSQPISQDGEIYPLGPTLHLPPPQAFVLAQEQYSTTYADASEPPERWEAVYEVDMKFLALEEGMATLGGVRVLVLTDEEGLLGDIGREWETLGDVWVSS